MTLPSPPGLGALAPAGAPASRTWLESAGWIAPAAAASRALLLADAAVLILLGLRARRPLLAVPAGLGGGFLALNALAMLATDFFVALLAFHALVGVAGLTAGGTPRRAGAALLAVTVALGVLT